MYSFLLILTKTDVRLRLMQAGDTVAEKNWTEGRDMGRQLFEGIATILQEYGLRPQDIADFQLETGAMRTTTGHESDVFWATKHIAPHFKNLNNEPFLSDLTGSTSIKIAETVARVYTWAVSEVNTKKSSRK